MDKSDNIAAHQYSREISPTVQMLQAGSESTPVLPHVPFKVRRWRGKLEKETFNVHFNDRRWRGKLEKETFHSITNC